MTILNLPKIGHDHGKLRIHAGISDKVTVFQRVFTHSMSLTITNLVGNHLITFSDDFLMFFTQRPNK